MISDRGNDDVRAGMMELARRLWPRLRRQPRRLWATVAATAALAIVGRLSPAAFGYAIDHGISAGVSESENAQQAIAFAAALFFAAEAAKMALGFAQSYLFATMGNQALREMRSDLIERTQSLPIAYFDKNPAGRTVTRVTTDAISLGDVFTQGLVAILSNAISLVAIVAAMFAISPKMAAATLTIAPPIVWISKLLSDRIAAALRQAKRKMAEMNSFVAESAAGMRTLQISLRAGRSSARFATLAADHRRVQMRVVHLYAMLWPAVNFFNAATVSLALWAGGWMTESGALSTGAMVAFILNVRDFINPMRAILEKYQVFQNSVSSAERVFALLDESPEPGLREDKTTAARNYGYPVANMGVGIEFKSITLSYNHNCAPAINKLDLIIYPGERVGLVGRTGSGKSTVISLLQGFYAPDSGELLIDGEPIRSIDVRRLRRRIGVIPQEPFLFKGTIGDNIGLRDPFVSAEMIKRAAELARCTPMLERRARGAFGRGARASAGLRAPVEERGANLSQGERQLIAFARLIAFDPKALILDEATASVDSQSEALIQEAVREATMGRTCLIVAHRLSTVMDCDRIVVLDQGRVVEQGTHRELCATDGFYAKMLRAQLRAEEDSLHLAPGAVPGAVG